MKVIEHIIDWNKWRKHNINSNWYKVKVLFGWPSPTFMISKFKINKEE
jgi:hypothetical protein